MSDPIHKRGHFIWDINREPIEAQWDLLEIPLLGLVSAGQPILMAEASETIRVPASLVRSHARQRSFALLVRGDSMIDDQIHDGDLVVIEPRPTAENGETVVARIDGYQVTLKRFYLESDGIRLQPANPVMAPLRFGGEQVEILGVVSGVIRVS